MKDYKLLDLQISDYKDTFGNTWCTAEFEGVSEPVKWVLKDPTKAVLGQTYYGEMQDKTSQAGKPYQRFYSKPKEGFTPSPKQTSLPTSPAKSDAYLKDMSNTPILMYNGSLNYAKDLGLNLIDKVEDRRQYLAYVQEVTDEMLSMIDNIRHPAEHAPKAEPTGYDKFKQAKANLATEYTEADVPDFGDE